MTTANIVGLSLMALFVFAVTGFFGWFWRYLYRYDPAKVLPAKNLGEGTAVTHEEMFLQFCAAAGLKPRLSTIPLVSREVRKREYTFEAKEMPNVEGYTGFVADFRFNADGTFEYLSIGE